MSQPTEQVHTMTHYYDGPHGGVADFNGKPHVYRSLWKDLDRGCDDVFELMPIDAETLTLALESWSIWTRWLAAFNCGETSIETHPALPTDRERSEHLKAQLDRLLAIESSTAITATADFEWPAEENSSLGKPAGVHWTLADRPTDCIEIQE